MTKKQTGRPGRPSGDASTNKATQISVRIPRSLRDDLEREAKRHRQSLSREIQNRLAQSLTEKKRLHHESDQTFWLGYMVRRLADGCEGNTEKPWPSDPFTFEAVVAAQQMLLSEMKPDGDVVIPARITADIEKKPFYRQFETPTGLAAAVTLGIIDQIRMTPPAPINSPKNIHWSDTFYWAPRVRKVFPVFTYVGPGANRDKETKT